MSVWNKKNVSNDVGFAGGGDELTVIADAPITGRRFVKLAPSTVPQELHAVQAGAGDKVFGVARWDAAKGEHVSVVRTSNGTEVDIAGAPLKGGDAVGPDANGKAVAVTDGKDAGVLGWDAAPNTIGAVFLTVR